MANEVKESGKKQITIYDIAKEAGVSASTVSRVLSSTTGVRKAKRDKVLEIVEKYNFKPSALAKNLSDTRSRVIGMLVADIVNPYYATLYVECQKAAEERGYTLLLAITHGRVENEIEQLERYVGQRVEAIIHIGGSPDSIKTDARYTDTINRMASSIPFVISGKLDGTNALTVRINETRAMELVMEHLVSLGHKRIALIGGRMDVVSTFEKYTGLREVLSKYEIPFDERYVVLDINDIGGYNIAAGAADMEEILRRDLKPTAVIAVNETSAIGAAQTILDHGYRIPEDISLVDFDNTYLSKVTIPHITSIDYNYTEFARKLLDTAVNAIEGEPQEEFQYIDPRLIVRDSTRQI